MPLRGKTAKIDLFKKVSLFAACTDKELRRIASLADSYEAKKGQVLTKEGAPGGEFFVISEGTAKATLRKKLLAKLGPGSFFGEMSLIDHGPRAATIVAETDMQLFVLDPRSFHALLNEAPSVNSKILRGLAERLREVENAPTH